MRWLMDFFARLRHSDPPPTPTIDQAALRDEMTRTDPDFARVREVHHDAMQIITGGQAARQIADGLAIRREVEFWERHGGHAQ